MLKDYDPIKIPVEINNNNYYLRFNLNAQLCFEYSTGKKFDTILKQKTLETEDTLQLLRALLIDNWYDENKEKIINREFDNVTPTLGELGRLLDNVNLTSLTYQIYKAIAESLPQIEATGNFQKAIHQKK